MHKLLILFDHPTDWHTFEQDWHKFLRLVERMPGLRRETVSREMRLVFGKAAHHYAMIHELLFDSKEALKAALNSPEGQAAGQWLQKFSRGQITLLTAEHMEAKPETFVRQTRT